LKTIRYYEIGGPEVLRIEDVPTPEPGPDQVLVKVAACSINYVDVARRSGHAPMAPTVSFPVSPGGECAGEVAAMGTNVSGVSLGDRVIVRGGSSGYAEYTVATPAQLLPVPESLSLVEASTIGTIFFTAWGCLANSAKLQQGEVVLVQSCAGGVGSALVQVAKHLGATVIGTSSSQEKLEWAKRLGVDHGVNYVEQDFVEEVKKLTDGKGVSVIADGVGGDMFVRSLKCLQRGGRIVIYGVSGGKRTAEITLPDLWFANHTIIGGSGGANRNDIDAVLAKFEEGTFRSVLDRTWPLAEAAEAHRYLEERRVRGKIALTVE
jgi:NADPH2:quinone reductase